MKRLMILAVIAAALLAGCSSSPEKDEEVTAFVLVTETATRPETIPEVTVKTAKIKKSKRNKNVSSVEKATEKPETKPKPTETSPETEAPTVPELPTQGVARPGGAPSVTIPNGSTDSDDLEFTYDGVTITLNEKFSTVFEELADDGDEDYEEDKSGAEYDFDNFVITTYYTDGAERVREIEVTDSDFKTPKGAVVGMYASRLRGIYGEPKSRTATEYIFGTARKSLVFSYSNNIVTGISFRLNV